MSYAAIIARTVTGKPNGETLYVAGRKSDVLWILNHTYRLYPNSQIVNESQDLEGIKVTLIDWESFLKTGEGSLLETMNITQFVTSVAEEKN